MGCTRLDILEKSESPLRVVKGAASLEKWESSENLVAVKNRVSYYPGGSIMPGRSYTSEKYRYGFNGMEKDDEIAGTGNSIDFGARGYDSRLLRWRSVDPKGYLQPGWSSYKAFLCNPLIYVDPEGETEYLVIERFHEATGETEIIRYEHDYLMTDGKFVHNKDWWGPRNLYYDYEVRVKETVHSDGTYSTQSRETEILTEKGAKDFERVYLWGDSYGDKMPDRTDLYEAADKEYAVKPSVKVDMPATNDPGGRIFPNGGGFDGNMPPEVSNQPNMWEVINRAEYSLDSFDQGDTVLRDRTFGVVDPTSATYVEVIDTNALTGSEIVRKAEFWNDRGYWKTSGEYSNSDKDNSNNTTP